MTERSPFRPTGKPRDVEVARLQREIVVAFARLNRRLNELAGLGNGANCCEENAEAIDVLAAAMAVLDHGALLGLADNDHPQYTLAATDMIAGAGLTGGGTLAADRTFNVGAGTGIIVNANDVEVDPAGIDHGALGGLGDNDHPQYLLVADLPSQVVRHTAMLSTVNALLSGTTRTTVGTTANVLVCDNAASEGGVWLWRVPPEWDGGNITFQCLVTPFGTSGGNVVVAVAIERNDASSYNMDAADSFDAVGVSVVVAVSATQGVVSVAEIDVPPSRMDGAVAGDFVRVRIQRLGSDAGDSNTDQMLLRDNPCVDYGATVS